ncbi:MAG: type VI secretion system baseplate subunit TssK [Planctomycetes bacterium]|jgi:type VI secretion system protein ImpJ|nr:type VI secretion system baseplate subunit TssK [Planctomycetota bacterium]
MSDFLTPIHWKEGLFLRPHHLQENQTYQARFLAHHLAILSPHHFGVREVEIDEGRLEDGIFVIRRLELVLPGGEVLRVPGNTQVESRKVLEPGPGRESRLKVFLGIRRWREQEPNVSDDGLSDRDPGRFLVTSRLVFDHNSGRDSQEVEFKQYNARIFFEGEPLEEYDALPIAEVVPPEVGLPMSKLSKTYIPPCVRIGASRVLAEWIRQLYSSAASKAARLAARADAEGIRVGEAVQGDVLSLWKLHTIQGYLPWLRDAVEVGALHPYPLFIELCKMAGQLSSFSASLATVELPMYDHREPEKCYGELIPILHRLLDELIPSNFARVPLTQVGFRYTGDLREEWLELKNRWFVAVRTDLPDALVDRWFRGTTKIAAVSRVDKIVNQRLRGVPEVKCERPRVLPPREGLIWFELQRDTADFNDVRAERTIAIHLAAEAGMTAEALAALGIELYVVFG